MGNSAGWLEQDIDLTDRTDRTDRLLRVNMRSPVNESNATTRTNPVRSPLSVWALEGTRPVDRDAAALGADSRS